MTFYILFIIYFYGVFNILTIPDLYRGFLYYSYLIVNLIIFILCIIRIRTKLIK